MDTTHGEVHKPRLTVEPHQDEASGKGYEDTREMDERCRDTAELEIEDEQDDHQCHGDDYLQSLGGMFLLFVGAGESIADTLGQHHLATLHGIVHHTFGLVHHVNLGQCTSLVESDIAHQEGVLAINHGGTRRKLDVGHLRQRYLGTIHCGHQDMVEHIGSIAQLTGIAYTDGEPFAPLYRAALAHAANGR